MSSNIVRRRSRGKRNRTPAPTGRRAWVEGAITPVNEPVNQPVGEPVNEPVGEPVGERSG